MFKELNMSRIVIRIDQEGKTEIRIEGGPAETTTCLDFAAKLARKFGEITAAQPHQDDWEQDINLTT